MIRFSSLASGHRYCPHPVSVRDTISSNPFKGDFPLGLVLCFALHVLISSQLNILEEFSADTRVLSVHLFSLQYSLLSALANLTVRLAVIPSQLKETNCICLKLGFETFFRQQKAVVEFTLFVLVSQGSLCFVV